VAEQAMAVRADDDEACLVLVCCLNDCLPGGRALDRERRRTEAGRLRQLGAVLGCLLGGVPDVVGGGSVELRAWLGHEPDAERAPHREDDRVATGRQLPAGLGDRLPGEVGAVVGDENRPGAVDVLAGRAPERTAGQRRGESAAALPGGDDSRGRGGKGWPGLPANRSQQRRGVPGGVLTAHPPPQRRSGQSDPAEQIEQDADDRAARGQTEADPQRGVHRGGRQASERGAEVQQDRHDHERCHRAQQLQDREHPLYRCRAEGETGQEQRRDHGRADTDADQPGARQGQGLGWRDGAAEHEDPGYQEHHSGQREEVDQALVEHRAENNSGEDGRDQLGCEEQAEVQRGVTRGEDGRGQRDCRGGRRGRADGDDHSGHRDRAGQRPYRQQRAAGGVLVDPQGGDEDQPHDQRNDRDGVEEPVGEQLGRAPERRNRAGRGQADREPVPRRAGVGWRGVLEGQHRHEQAGRGDPGHDPEQRAPGVERRLGAADQRPRGHGPEDAHVQDHRGRAELGRREAEEERRRGGDQQHAGEQALQHVPGDEHRGEGRGRGQHGADHERASVHEQQPPLRQQLGKLHRQDRPHRVGRIGQAPGQGDRLQAHVQLRGDDRRQRLQRRG
jgi:hypothetical protein